jgi:hypothetical protein
MNYPINYSQLSDKAEFYKEVIEAHEEAESFLNEFAWWRTIFQSEIYINLGATLCVFLFQIDNVASKEDSNLWVIVGDIPPMYLDTHGPQTTKQVVSDYVRLADEWITNVKARQSTKQCFPFKAEPTIEMATLLESRTSFMKEILIDNIDDISVRKFSLPL